MPARTTPFRESQRRYEQWLAGQVDEIWARDLREKHRKIRESAFVFLRGTYWRWAETILTACSDLADAPAVLGVGDIHLENYGVWRDDEGRLVWGINDFDEAAEMPYALDLVRLATSAVLSGDGGGDGRKTICATILEGYREGLTNPRPFTLDEKHLWLRTLFEVSEEERAHFWKKIRKIDEDNDIPTKYRNVIEVQLPGRDATVEKFGRRDGAGTGSLGRPRWIGVATWRGGRLIREAKAIVASGWTLAHPRAARTRAIAAMLAGRYRAPDPWSRVTGDVAVRRLSPNARKIEVEHHAKALSDRDMLHAMGHELANAHLGGRVSAKTIATDLDGRGDRWLARATHAATDAVTNDFDSYRK
jgi:uncharacterized protein (DUF2252 family)